MRLEQALRAWNSTDFEITFKRELEALGGDALPLQAGLSQGNYATDENFGVLVIGSSDTPDCVRVHAGIYYTGIIAGCACVDDPTPMSGHTEYCEMQFEIDKATAETRVALLPDQSD